MKLASFARVSLTSGTRVKLAATMGVLTQMMKTPKLRSSKKIATKDLHADDKDTKAEISDDVEDRAT